jgi:hypothetical protein
MVYTVVDLLGGLRVDISLANDAAEGCLDMAGRTAETVIKIEMPERGIEIVAPEQAHHPAAEPKAFGLAAGPPGASRLPRIRRPSSAVPCRRPSAACRAAFDRRSGQCSGRLRQQHRRAESGGENSHTGKRMVALDGLVL